MNNKKKNVNEPPFYYEEGKGWYIKGKFKHDGKWVNVQRKYFATKKDAVCAYDSVVAEKISKLEGKAKEIALDESMRYEDFVELFLEYRRGEVRGSSLSSQELPAIHVFFDPMFKGKTIAFMFSKKSSIELHRQIEQCQTRCTKNKNRAVNMYLRMLEYAYLSDFITDERDYKACKVNMRRIKENHEADMARSKQKHALTLDEVGKLLAYTDGTKDAFFMRLLWATACRINEFCALKVRDFDIEAKTVTIQRQWAVDEQGGRFLTGTLKNRKGYRTIPLQDDMVSAFLTHVYENGLKKDDLLFEGERDRHIDTSAFDKRLRKYCRCAGVTEITSHEFRHSKATLMSKATNNDMERQAVAYILGHSVTVDQEIYASHQNADEARKLIAKTHTA